MENVSKTTICKPNLKSIDRILFNLVVTSRRDKVGTSDNQDDELEACRTRVSLANVNKKNSFQYKVDQEVRIDSTVF